MLDNFKNAIQKKIKSFGYQITKTETRDPVIDKEFSEIYRKCKDYTMTSKERMFALYKAVKYAVLANLPGDFVECGVWKGGSAMIIAYTLLEMNVKNKKIYLYDTFEGMSKPTAEDYNLWAEKQNTEVIWETGQSKDHNEWCCSLLDEVIKNMKLTGYPEENLIYVKGKVEDTIPKTMPSVISLLRLDTDWYESTKHELIYLYPILSVNGVLVIDDYGYWAGAKKAVDEYFFNKPILLNRVDYTGRVGIKV